MEAFDMIGFAGQCGDSTGLGCGKDTVVDCVAIRLEPRVRPIHYWNLSPQFFGTLPTTVPNVKGQPLPCVSLQREPEPLPVCLLPDKAPHLVGFCFQLVLQHSLAPCRVFDMEMSGSCLKALDHQVQQPSEADAHCAADPA